MPASTLTELYNFEGNIESAFNQWLADQSISAFQSQDNGTLPDYYISTSFSLGAATGHAGEIYPGVWEYDQYECSIDFTIKTRRNGQETSNTENISSKNHELVAMVRNYLNVSVAKFSQLNDYLNFYEFQFLRPNGTSYETSDDFDDVVLTFDGQFSILPSAWPYIFRSGRYVSLGAVPSFEVQNIGFELYYDLLPGSDEKATFISGSGYGIGYNQATDKYFFNSYDTIAGSPNYDVRLSSEVAPSKHGYLKVECVGASVDFYYKEKSSDSYSKVGNTQTLYDGSKEFVAIDWKIGDSDLYYGGAFSGHIKDLKIFDGNTQIAGYSGGNLVSENWVDTIGNVDGTIVIT